jgi:gliding motility-associated-like protein
MRVNLTVLLLLFSFLGLHTELAARHIIGGVITYECLGEGDYEFTMKIYRDCNCTNCADFDQEAFIAIYECTTGGNCQNLSQSSYIARLDVPLMEVNSVEEPDYPCLIPPNVCVEEGIYQFRLSNYGLRLPLSDQSYHISYQRCCRNITINNIVRPEDSGATYTIEITPEAQRLCNNSPVFDEFPPTIICAGAPLNFDHSATDADGDQLVYEFCPPLLGGGPGLDPGLYATCSGAAPNPACPPPYDNVSFILPTFTADEPMGGNPVVRINPNTGLITGTPIIQGQFVVGVCVKEYRDGELLSTVFRDFQFNVASCDPTVVADIREDKKINDQEFLINSCGDFTIDFVNESYQERFIDYHEWRFDIDGETQTFTEWSPTVTFPGLGEYEGQLILNPETDCGDTANIYVNLFPAINADFEFAFDSCEAAPIPFTDLSETGAQRIEQWNWSFGDGGSSQARNPRYLFRQPGDWNVSLQVTDNNECADVATKPLRYFPVPPLLIISPSTFRGCVPAGIFFDNLSEPIDETYDITWEFGDGGTSPLVSPWHTYEEPGVYTVSLDITSPIGCKTDTTFFDLITVEESPKAGFSFAPDQPSNINPTVEFTDESERANQWLWDFGTGKNSLQRNPSYTFPDTGRYEVRQIVTHPNGCTDTLLQIVDVLPEVRYFLPNAFTPNSDAVNDEYKGTGFLVGASNFNMSIWNRWGEMVFQTANAEEGWNGRKFNNGQSAPNGVYVVLVTFNGPRGERYQFKSFATLIR